jgi:hypothetical protein
LPPVHFFPQPPQLLSSVRVLTQVPLHSAAPGQLHGSPHTPSKHGPPPQLVPQDPQFLGSVSVSTQTPLQSIIPPTHTHAPSTQEKPFAVSHGLSQAPQ